MAWWCVWKPPDCAAAMCTAGSDTTMASRSRMCLVTNWWAPLSPLVQGSDVSPWANGRPLLLCAGWHCPECIAGNGQVCRNQAQPGFTHWGSYAELVALHDGDINLIAIPQSMDSGAAAVLGCRFATAYRGLLIAG